MYIVWCDRCPEESVVCWYTMYHFEELKFQTTHSGLDWYQHGWCPNRSSGPKIVLWGTPDMTSFQHEDLHLHVAPLSVMHMHA